MYHSTHVNQYLLCFTLFQFYVQISFGKTKKLAAKPKPWRINLLLYLVYEGWLLIKKHVIKKFEISKDTSYITFLDLLDNLIPATLDVYTCLFKKNHFEENVDTIFRLSTTMQRFRRHNYDKIMLAYLLYFS